MTLREIIERLDEFEDEATIVAAEPWTPQSKALAYVTDSARTDDIQREGMSYFLEVDIAREVRSDFIDGGGNLADLCNRIIQYATTDA